MRTEHEIRNDRVHIRNTFITAIGLIVGYLDLMALACAFAPTIHLPNY